MDKKYALVTGANKGLGLEISRQLGKKGFTVFAAARTLAKATQAASHLREAGVDVHAVELDVTNRAHWAAAAASMCW